MAQHTLKLGIDSYAKQFCAYVIVYRGRMYEFEPKVISFATGDNQPLFDDHEGQYVRKPEVFEKGGSKLYGRVLNDTRKRLQCYLFFNQFLCSIKRKC